MIYTVPYVESPGNIVATSKAGRTLLRYPSNSDGRYQDEFKNYRAVVYDEGRNVVAFTPPKMTLFENFVKEVPFERAQLREYIDGTMVYAYFCQGAWNLGTRSTLDAETTYRCGIAPPEGVAELSPPPLVPHLKELALQQLNYLFPTMDVANTYVFSFIHPLAFNTIPRTGLYLIAVYKTLDGATVEELPLPDGFLTAPLVNAASYRDLQLFVANAPRDFKGVVMHDPTTGMFAKLIAPNFVYLHKLWVNPSVNRTLAYWLRKNDAKLVELLDAYPEFAPNVEKIKTAIVAYGRVLYKDYVDCFIYKKKPLKEYPRQARNHLYHLHGMYLFELRDTRSKMSLYKVFEYLENLDGQATAELF
jgi:hypothetical protein